MDNETAGKLRGMIRRVVVRRVDDTGAAQTATVEVAKGITRSKVEVLQPFGLAANPPLDGAAGVMLAAGGDEGDAVLLPLANHSSRFGGCAAGESALYNAGGDYVRLGADGTLEIAIGAGAVFDLPAGLLIKAPKVTIEAGELVVEKDITCKGSIKAAGDVSDKKGSMEKMRGTYNSHSHPSTGTPPGDKME